jgi:hypothetical protein
MYHTIEFLRDFAIDLEISPRHRLGRMQVHKGTRLQAETKPYVIQTERGPTEVADLFLADGPTVRRVPFHSFKFVDWATEPRINHSS